MARAVCQFDQRGVVDGRRCPAVRDNLDRCRLSDCALRRRRGHRSRAARPHGDDCGQFLVGRRHAATDSGRARSVLDYRLDSRSIDNLHVAPRRAPRRAHGGRDCRLPLRASSELQSRQAAQRPSRRRLWKPRRRRTRRRHLPTRRGLRRAPRGPARLRPARPGLGLVEGHYFRGDVVRPKVSHLRSPRSRRYFPHRPLYAGPLHATLRRPPRRRAPPPPRPRLARGRVRPLLPRRARARAREHCCSRGDQDPRRGRPSPAHRRRPPVYLQLRAYHPVLGESAPRAAQRPALLLIPELPDRRGPRLTATS
mmetsp:Transcript_16842/g.52646  ORF Transcript_16842/g.52646 Transcript_16842/m.52646 type:complete len:310 (+) Transcript_16842:352-1281(+)